MTSNDEHDSATCKAMYCHQCGSCVARYCPDCEDERDAKEAEAHKKDAETWKVVELPRRRTLTPAEIAPENAERLAWLRERLMAGEHTDPDNFRWVLDHLDHLREALGHVYSAGDPQSLGFAGTPNTPVQTEMQLEALRESHRSLAERALRGEKLFNDGPPPQGTAICPGCGKGFITGFPVDPRYKCPKCTFGVPQ